MFELSGFRFLEELGSNEEISLYRIERIEDHYRFIAKTVPDSFVGSHSIATFQYEYEQLLKLKGKGTLEPYSLHIVEDRPVLLMHDPGGMTLKQCMGVRRGSLKLSDLLSIAIMLVDCLRLIHHEHILLNEMTPLQFIVNDSLTSIGLIDIRSHTSANGSHSYRRNEGIPDSLLPYLCPEQTGRTGRVPDYRSDFYSLGIILYEWFAGSLPFMSENTLDLIHHHLATTPESIFKRNHSIPRMVSDIVMKCMEKMPEARYVSAYGIKADLEECLIQLRVSGKVQPFRLGMRDISEQWVMSNGLVGRSDEQQMLLQAMQRAADGEVEVVWLSGDTGTGKTALVVQTLRQAIPDDAFFIMTSDLVHEAAKPYRVWFYVMEQLGSQLLTLNQLQAEVWRLRLLEAVQGYGRLLTNQVPRLKLLIGEQPDLGELSHQEMETRLYEVMDRFFQLFFRNEQPLVLLLDNLQEADEPSLQYLAHLLWETDADYFLFIGAYRDAEVAPDHPLRRLISQHRDRHIPTAYIHLQTYDHTALRQMLIPMIPATTDGLDELVDILLHKTDGNPLYFKQFVEDILEHKWMYFNGQERVWRWNAMHIAAWHIPEELAVSILHSWQSVPSEQLNLLAKAACMGLQFDLETLAAVTDITVEAWTEWADAIASHRLMLRLPGTSKSYVFQHELIQHRAYGRLSPIERTELHAAIGWNLTDRMKSGEPIAVAEVLGHLNQAMTQVQLRSYRKYDLAELNIQAGIQAKMSSEAETARGFFQRAVDLFDEGDWDTHYSIIYQANKELVEAELLCDNYAAAQDMLHVLLARAVSDMDKAQVCILMTELAMNRHQYEQVKELANKSLKWLGISHNLNPSSAGLMLHWLRVKRRLPKDPKDMIEKLPPMTDERYQAAIGVLGYICNASLALNTMDWVSAILFILELTLDHGMTPQASIGFSGYAFIQHYIAHHDEEAYHWGKAACTVSKQDPILYMLAKNALLLCDQSWSKYEPDYLLTYGEQQDHDGKLAVNRWHTNQNVLIHCAMLFQYSHPLPNIYSRLITHSSSFLTQEHSLHWKQAAVLSQLITRLTGSRASVDPFAEEDMESPAFLNDVNGRSTALLQEAIRVYQYITGYLFGDYIKAYQALRKSLGTELSGGLDSSSCYYLALVLKELYTSATKKEKAQYLVEMRHCLKNLKKFAHRCPERDLHKYLLVKAEVARLKRKYRQAEQWYGEAFIAARSRKYIHDTAIIAESYAQYAMVSGRAMLAKLYIHEAYEAYKKWGALAKAEDMQRKYGDLLQVKQDTATSLERIDYMTVAMSAQAMSSEMEMDRLLRMLMRIMLQNAGAEYGALLFQVDDQWMVEGYGTVEQLHIESIPLEEAGHLVPTAIIDYTARTQEELILHDISNDSVFERNAYIKKKALKSVLCLPIMHQNQRIGLLYMENNLSTGIFTEERLDVLRMLSSQCAISIANAKLYSSMHYLKNNLEQQVVERTRSLEKSMKAASEALAETSVYAERTRIAQEIHDIVGHTLTSTIVQIEAGNRLLSRDMDGAVQLFKGAQDLVRHSLQEIRNSVHMLKEDRYYDIEEALHQLIQDSERSTGVIIHALIDPISHLTLMQKKVIYHALQEGLTNGIKHGNCTEFSLSIREEGHAIHFRLADNGDGADQIDLGFGLKMMRERVHQLKGTLYVESEPGKGCLLWIYIPYRE